MRVIPTEEKYRSVHVVLYMYVRIWCSVHIHIYLCVNHHTGCRANILLRHIGLIYVTEYTVVTMLCILTHLTCEYMFICTHGGNSKCCVLPWVCLGGTCRCRCLGAVLVWCVSPLIVALGLVGCHLPGGDVLGLRRNLTP